VKLSEESSLMLCQNYNREALRIAMQIGWRAHAKQYGSMKRSSRTSKSRVGRVYRDIDRQIDQITESRLDAAKDLTH